MRPLRRATGPTRGPLGQAGRGGRSRPRAFAALAVLVAFLAFAAHSPILGNGFIILDDRAVVTENERMQQGLTWESLGWALTTTDTGSWVPLAWLSHLLDVQLYGLKPFGHHLTSLLLHMANSVLVLLVLRGYTGGTFRSAAAAAVFAVHPLHVESVAWVTERRDVLFLAFFLLAVIAHRWRARRPGAWRAGVVFALALLSLASKPMAVTLPLALLLLDVWPLGRLRGGPREAAGTAGPGALLREKAPLFILAGSVAVVTFLSQRGVGAVRPAAALPVSPRLWNAAISYVKYLGLVVWPRGLAVFYPHPGEAVSRAEGLLAALVLAGLTAAAWRLRNSRPYLLWGWLWYLATLFPVIGLFQAGGQAMADRFVYLPLIGIYAAVAWACADLSRGLRLPAPVPGLLLGAAVTALLPLSRTQAALWRDDFTLSSHALRHTRGNYLAANNLGVWLQEQGRREEAEAVYRDFLRERPDDAAAHHNLAVTLAAEGRHEEALEEFRAAIRLAPTSARGHYGAGLALARLGRTEEAIASYREAIRLEPGLEGVLADLGIAEARLGRFAEARAVLREAIRRRPGDPRARYHLGLVAAGQGRHAEAVRAYHEALGLRPTYPEAWADLGVALARQGRLKEAEQALREALRLHPDDALARYNLGLTLAAGQRHTEAVAEYLEALRLRPDFAEARSDLGVSYAALGREGEALAQFREAVRLAPGLASARANLERALASRAEGTRRRNP